MPNLPRIGVVGSGVIGLLSAEALVEAGYRVTVVARDLPGDAGLDWASPWAGAVFSPYWDSKDHGLQIDSFQYYWALAHQTPISGVRTIKITEYYDDRSSDESIWFKDKVPHYKLIPVDKLPPGIQLGFSYTSMVINPTVFLPWMKQRLDKFGVKFVRKEVSSLEEAGNITQADIIVNATGLGAAPLAADSAVMPVRGQTMLVKSDFDEVVLRQGDQYSYAIPRMFSGAVVLGGVTEHHSLDRNVNTKTRADILRKVNLVTNNAFANLKPDQVVQDIVGFRPARQGGHRLEREGNIIHAYGFGGFGYVYSAGVALRVKELVSQKLTARL